ncbi:hypothetical protein D6774_03505 [Candidatus Woesearchaeota archaeon]|nr:MAG: hypothetical protein D6774_03505 [Candidatus Woesearchaeota archaeon]
MRRVKRKVRHVLEKQITIGSLLRSLGVALLVILCLGIIFGVPYQLGKASVDCATTSSDKSDVSTDASSKTSSAKNTKNTMKEQEKNKQEDKVVAEESLGESDKSSSSQESVSETSGLSSIDYDDVSFSLEDITFDKRGEDWGTIREVSILIENQASAPIDIAQLRMRVYGDGESVPEWEDFDVVLAPIEKGITTVKTIPVHYSLTDISQEKTLIIELRDDDNNIMGEITQSVSLI